MSIPPNTIRDKRQQQQGQQAIIALGANVDSPLGAPDVTVLAAAHDLRALGSVQLSSLLSTAPANCPPGSPDFVNAVALVQIEQPLSALALLAELQSVERRYGRRRAADLPVNAPRPLDLDLISYGELRLESAELTLPHPRAHQRQFVLAPLAELAPDLTLPGFTLSVQALLAALSDEA
ncbi:MAG: 2-amino-4-hydroxy-6-hydroxymethyldihydropteridine diphosphokinase [Pseudohongiellaceae bacterium]